MRRSTISSASWGSGNCSPTSPLPTFSCGWAPNRRRTDPRGRSSASRIAGPTTASTAFPEDAVGTVVSESEHPQVLRALVEGRVVRGEDETWREGMPPRREAVPVRLDGRVIAVLSRDTNLSHQRAQSPLELAYLDCAEDLCQMISDGTLPDPGIALRHELEPTRGRRLHPSRYRRHSRLCQPERALGLSPDGSELGSGGPRPRGTDPFVGHRPVRVLRKLRDTSEIRWRTSPVAVWRSRRAGRPFCCGPWFSSLAAGMSVLRSSSATSPRSSVVIALS